MLRMSICAYVQAQELRHHLIRALHNVGTTFLVMEDKEDSVAGPSQHMYLAESSAEMSAILPCEGM